MRDQAAFLREIMKDKNQPESIPRITTIAVTSGKGGVGKTSIAVNLAILMQKSGRNVRLIDADLGLSNAEVLLGISPAYTLADIMHSRVSARDAWTDSPGGVKLLSSGSGIEELANMDKKEAMRLVSEVLNSASDGDVVIMDTAPGINSSVTSLFAFADEIMVVTTAEPTSITDSYAAIKVLLSGKPDADITLIANSCSSPAQAASVAGGLDNICKKFLKQSFQRYEYLPSDSAVGWAIRNQKPLALSSSHAMVTTWLRKLAIKLDERIRRKEIDRLSLNSLQQFAVAEV